MDLSAKPHEYVQSKTQRYCEVCGFSESNTEAHILEDRTIYIDGEGGTYSRSTPHVFKKRPVDLACYCGLDINDPVHTEGIDLTPPTFIDPDEIEEYVPVQHYYAGTDGGPCLVCHKAYLNPIHLNALDKVLEPPRFRHMREDEKPLADLLSKADEEPMSRIDRLKEDNRVLRETNERTEAYLKGLEIHSKNPHSFFTKGDKIVLSGLGAFFVANLTVGIVNMVM